MKVFKSSRFPVHLNWVLFPDLVIERCCCLSKESIRKLSNDARLVLLMLLMLDGWMDRWMDGLIDYLIHSSEGRSKDTLMLQVATWLGLPQFV